LRHLVENFKQFGFKIGMPTCIKELVSEEDFYSQLERMVEYTMSDMSSLMSPRPIDRKVVKQIFVCAFHGNDVDF
jgi:alcohol dehydrogenase class IV